MQVKSIRSVFFFKYGYDGAKLIGNNKFCFQFILGSI